MNLKLDIPNHFEFVIIGAGLSGAKLFVHLSKIAPTLLIDKKNPTDKYYSAKIVCNHDIPWLSDIPINDKRIFERDHWKTNYSSKNINAIIDGKEFLEPLGKIVNFYEFINYYIQKGQELGGFIAWNKQVINISITKNNAIINTLNTNKAEENKEITANMVILATGSNDYALQQQLNLPIPKLYNSISTVFKGSKEQLDQNISEDYLYHLNSNISQSGMLWMNRANTFFNIGYVSNEKREDMELKFVKILQNYQPIQHFFTKLAKKTSTLAKEDFHFSKTARTAIKTMVSNRIILIGDAAGLLYSLYFEGIIGCLVSSTIASDVLTKLFQEKKEYLKHNLMEIQKRIYSQIINTYFKMGDIATEMFFGLQEIPRFSIWESYLKAIKINQKVRKNIWTAFQWKNLAEYPEKNDEWCGKKIFEGLPLSKKIAYGPFFLKLKLK